jgi:hypothetical protein
MRYIFLVIMGSNLYNMIRTPWDGEPIHVAMMTIYWLLTFFSVLFMSLSFIKDDLRYIRPSYAILATANILGIYDFGNANSQMSVPVKSISNIAIFYFVTFFLINSKHTKFK